MSAPEKLRLDLPLVLAGVDDPQDRCVGRLTDALSGRPGIEEAHVVAGHDAPPQLCVHFDPNRITFGRVRELVHSVGAQLSSRYAHLTLRTSGPLHARSARRLAVALRDVPGVLEAEVAASGALRIEFDRSIVSEQALMRVITSLGLSVDAAARAQPVVEATADSDVEASPLPHGQPAPKPPGGETPRDRHNHDDHDHDHQDESGKTAKAGAAHAGHDHADGEGDHAGHNHAHGGLFGERSELIFALLAGALVVVGWLIERATFGPEWLPTACYVGAYVFGGYFTVKEAVENLRARRFEIDTLMLVAAAGAAALGQWAEGGLLLFLFSLGHSLEHYAMGRARRAIEALAKLAPDTAMVRRDGRTEEVALNSTLR